MDLRIRMGLRVAVSLLMAGTAGCAFEIDESYEEVSAPLTAADPSGRAALALRWAPIHYQDVDPTGSHALSGRADYITRVDFDGDWNTRNNWDNAGLASYPLQAHAYYSVVETSTHWFILYMFYHPRDWVDYFFDTEHENDAEGVLLSVARDGTTYGSLKSAVTVAHADFFSFLPAGSTWTSGAENVDGTLQLASYGGSLHPVTAQEAKGHGLKARPYYDIQGGDGIVYYPSGVSAEVPEGPNDRNVLYRLVDIFEAGGLWERRYQSATFASWGSFAGDTSGGCGSGAISCNTNSANAPWGWDDGNDGPARGALATDPAALTRNYFGMPESFSLAYTFNPYR